MLFSVHGVFVCCSQPLPCIHAHDTMVVEPLLVADAICVQIIVLDGWHCISCKAFILPLEEEDRIPSCAVELKHKRAASRLCLEWCPHSSSVVVCSQPQGTCQWSGHASMTQMQNSMCRSYKV